MPGLDQTGGRWHTQSSKAPTTPLKHAFDLFSKDKEKQRYKNPFFLLSKFYVGQGEREERKNRRTRILLPLHLFQQQLQL